MFAHLKIITLSLSRHGYKKKNTKHRSKSLDFRIHRAAASSPRIHNSKWDGEKLTMWQYSLVVLSLSLSLCDENLWIISPAWLNKVEFDANRNERFSRRKNHSNAISLSHSIVEESPRFSILSSTRFFSDGSVFPSNYHRSLIIIVRRLVLVLNSPVYYNVCEFELTAIKKTFPSDIYIYILLNRHQVFVFAMKKQTIL